MMQAILQGLLPRRKKQRNSSRPKGYRRSRLGLELLEVREVLSTFGVQVFDDGVLMTGTTTTVGNQLLFNGSSEHFNTTLVLGSTNSPGSPSGAIIQVAPNSEAQSTTTGTHTLTVELTSTDFSEPTGSPLTLSSSGGGEYDGNGSVVATYQGYLDPNNTAFGQPAGDGTPVLTASAVGPMNSLIYTTPTNPSNPGTAIATVTQPNTLFSLTGVAVFTIDAAGGDIVNLGATTSVAPSPVSTPSITTTPSPTSVTLSNTTPPVLTDTADLTGGNSPTGTITFTLHGPTGTLVDTETVNVNGNGDYTTPTGYTLPTTAVTGTYQWDASYGGDSNNIPVSENGAANEQVVVSPASTAITTTPNVTTVTLGTSTETLKDTAVLSGGYAPTGTITFTLLGPGDTVVDTETATVNGNGSYTTPTGYTLPTTAVTGTYQWDASYGGDSNNIPVSENGAANEQVVVSPASPAITTTPNLTTVTLGTNTVTLKDTAALSGGYSPTGTITFTLVAPNGSVVDTETDAVNGNGSYTTPNGYTLPTTAVTGTYQWDASYSGDSNNNAVSDNNASDEQVVVTGGVPAIAITKTADQGTVAAGQTIGFTVTITNTGTAADNNVTLSDPLPPGSGGDVSWTIDTTKGNPGDFTITGSKGSQTLVLSSSFISGGDSLAPGQSITVHITSPTNTGDVSGGAVGVQSGVSAATYLGAAGNYAVLYEGTGGHNLQITNVTIGGSVGDGGTGHVQFNGPGVITGKLDIAAANSGQFSNNNGSNIGPASVNYSASVVTTALNTVNSLNSSLAGLGTSANIAINGTQTINESAGELDTVNGVTYRVFNVTSYSENNGNLVTINGDGSGDPVVLNFAFNQNVNLGGDVAITGNGLSDDKVIWNFTSSNQNIQLNNNASSYPTLAFHGIVLAPNNAISLVNANLDGRVFGGDSHDMQIVSGDTIHAPILNTATVSASNVPSQSASAAITVTTAQMMWASNAAAAQLPAVNTLGEATPGVYFVAVDGLASGSAGAQEQARIADAISTLNAELGSLGVQLVKVPDGDPSANVTLSLDAATPVGGLANGVLGVTLGENITIDSAANYYLGADAAGIGADQYDFETLVVHELAHAVGIGEGVDPSSAMYPYLAPGTVRRDLSTTDLTELGAEVAAPNAATSSVAGTFSQDGGSTAVASVATDRGTDAVGVAATLTDTYTAPASEEGVAVAASPSDVASTYSARITTGELQEAATVSLPQLSNAAIAAPSFQAVPPPGVNATSLLSTNVLENTADRSTTSNGQNAVVSAIVTDRVVSQNQLLQDVSNDFVTSTDRSATSTVDAIFASMDPSSLILDGSGNGGILDVGGDGDAADGE